MSYKERVEQLCEAALHPGKTIMATKKESGKDLVGCFPIHTPEEIVYAAGCVPIGMWGGKTEIQLADKYLQSFCCSIMRVIRSIRSYSRRSRMKRSISACMELTRQGTSLS